MSNIKNKSAIYAGTFDPFTNGHDDIVKRALNIFDDLTILVAKSPVKKPLFSVAQRVGMLNNLYAKDDRITIDSWEGLLVDYANEKGKKFLVRGLRPSGDFEIEFQMASMNHNLNDDIDTIFLMTGPDHYFISSTLIREIFQHGGDIESHVPPIIFNKMKELNKG